MRNLIVLFGDQLAPDSTALDGFDADRDAVLMMEVAEEATYVPQHKQRLVLFFAAMRHFAADLRARDIRVHYSELDDAENTGSFGNEIPRWLKKLKPERVVAMRPGDWRVLEMLERAVDAAGLPLDLREDDHFLSTPAEFSEFAAGRKALVMEGFYRGIRRRLDILMEGDGPVGGKWNFDHDNRKSFGKKGAPEMRPPKAFAPDAITRAVMKLVEERFPEAPGRLEDFNYPVTRQEALEALDDFVAHRLPQFGDYQDAMVTGEPFLYHSRLSCVLNLHLLDPRAAVAAAVQAYEAGDAPLNAVEGFVRQIIGWREYIRGIYWTEMPGYARLNALEANLPVPAFFWTGETEMACIRDAVGQLNDHAYAHHIQRLMVLGLFQMLLGVDPYQVHRWHMSMYADAIDWVSLPNVVGMSQYGDGGIVGTKPYSASGAYIDRMGDHCAGCRFNPKQAVGEDACPFTTLYWDFLSRNRGRLRHNRRMQMQLRNLDRKSDADLEAIRARAAHLKQDLTRETYL